MRFAAPALVALAATGHAAARAFNNELVARTTTDTCAEVDAGLSVNILGISIVVGLVEVCLCISGIPLFVKSNSVAIAAVNIAGIASVSAELTAMINTAKGHQKCTYPDNCDPLCAKSNPCGFQCKNGFSPFPPSKPTDCVCLSPKKVCNGICGDFPSCPSAHPKRELEMAKRYATCDKGFTACGVFGWPGMRASQAWECIDTTSDLESCGGCAVPLTISSPQGIDCTAIPGVADVSCHAGSCMVHRCLPGYTPSHDRSFCIHASNLNFGSHNTDVPAAAYGLEHVPFQKKEE
ncbi:hypothetical protein BXZ70DRAFT_348089 [Cristinia sonorae]|uniref:Protein CPL1-like domain-containing protein n=1 Tax=Cristinia sonorae TaxID=1940300 RepID=A0A8K0UKI8_9AGAR|nr:hypothetical protein BXZ70DRAFT_348089 [Cristinia sonorae]